MTTLPPIQIWPVIHLADENRRALLQQNLSVIQGTDCSSCAGVFLIHMNGDDEATPGHQFFGSVAFKYQPHEPDAPAAATAAADLGMLATTSGAATGKAPDLAKLRAMREALGTHPLAVASGITPDNIHDLGGPLTHVLVSTGVSRNFHELDGNLLDRLAKAAANAPRCLGDMAVGRSRQDTIA